MALLWREEGRPLRTTAMVITSFIACWMAFFVWMLPFQRPLPDGFFLAARVAAASNVLISPAIYVYRNQVAQTEATRVLAQLFCRRWTPRHGASRSPVVPPWAPVNAQHPMMMDSSMYPHPGSSGCGVLPTHCGGAHLSRRSSLTTDSTGSPRKGSDEEPREMDLPSTQHKYKIQVNIPISLPV